MLIDAARRMPWIADPADANVRRRRRTMVIAAILLLVALFGAWTWSRQPKVQFRAFIPHAESAYPSGTVVGGLKWNPAWTDVRIDVENGQLPIRNLDFTVETDALIAGVGQVSQLPEFAAFPVPQMLDDKGNGFIIGQGGMVFGTDDKGNTVSEPFDFGKTGDICQTYHLHCGSIYSKATLHIVVGTVRFNAPGPHGEPPKQLVAPANPPKSVHLKGNYETAAPEGARRYTFDQTIQLTK